MTTNTSEPTEYDLFASTFDNLLEPGQASDPADDNSVGAANAQITSEPGDGQNDFEGSDEGAADAASDDSEGHEGGDGGVPDSNESSVPAQGQVDWEARAREYEAQLTQLRQPAPAAPAPAAEAETPIYSESELAELKELQDDWPAINRLFSLLARQTQVDTLKYAFSEVGKAISPLREMATAYSTEGHVAALYEGVPDYDQVYQPVLEWIETQPAFLKSAYQQVVQRGTANDVVSMISQFKKETGWGKQATPAAPAQKTLSEAAKKAAKAMGAVGTKRTAVSTAADPNDFESAWNEATGTTQ